jgi:predicted DsbA family dithiol-disulfide isomerase
MTKKISIDVVSDIACPWCFIGKRRLEKAIESLPEYEIKVNWHPFQLDPTIPNEGLNKAEYMANKFGSKERYEMLAESVINAGKDTGINFDFFSSPKMPNTMKMHQLIHVATKEGFAEKLEEVLFKAYFEEGIDLVDNKELIKLMLPFGWTEAYTQSILDDKEIAYWVTQEIRSYQQMGVTGVPFFIFNNTHAFSGAQPPQVFIDAVKSLENKQEGVTGDSCAVEDPNC